MFYFVHLDITSPVPFLISLKTHFKTYDSHQILIVDPDVPD